MLLSRHRAVCLNNSLNRNVNSSGPETECMAPNKIKCVDYSTFKKIPNYLTLPSQST